VAENAEIITVVPVEAAHGAEPEETFRIFMNAVHLVVGQAGVYVQCGKLNGLPLPIGKRQQHKQEWNQ
jgi:hypothetical protein